VRSWLCKYSTWASNPSCGHHSRRTALQNKGLLLATMSSNVRRTPTPSGRDQYAQVSQQSTSYLPPKRPPSSSGRRTPQTYLSPPTNTVYGPRQPQYAPVPQPVPTPPQHYPPQPSSNSYQNDTRPSRQAQLNRSDTVYSVARHTIGGALGPYAVIFFFFALISISESYSRTASSPGH
jgi:hypothetical protein